MSVLEGIIQVKQRELAVRKARLPGAALQSLLSTSPSPRNFFDAIQRVAAVGQQPAIIAEIKRASPSKGVLRSAGSATTWRPVELAHNYVAGGATCLSVLTDTRFFWGQDDLLSLLRNEVSLPLLRKDFVVDPYQIDEARWLGADAVLLMASVLAPETLAHCAHRAAALGMTSLIEVHRADELDWAGRIVEDLAAGTALLGINHRDLHTLEIDLERVFQLWPGVPDGAIVIAESGLSDAAQLQRLQRQGVQGFLIGGHLAADDNPATALRRLLNEAQN